MFFLVSCCCVCLCAFLFGGGKEQNRNHGGRRGRKRETKRRRAFPSGDGRFPRPGLRRGRLERLKRLSGRAARHEPSPGAHGGFGFLFRGKPPLWGKAFGFLGFWVFGFLGFGVLEFLGFGFGLSLPPLGEDSTMVLGRGKTSLFGEKRCCEVSPTSVLNSLRAQVPFSWN